MIKIDEIELALKHTEKVLLEKKIIKKPIFSTLKTNYKRHLFILCNDGTRIYFMFKREPLYSWLKLFPQLEKIEGNVDYVDSINVKLYYDMVDRFFSNNNKKGMMVICYGDGTVVSVSVKEWLKRANSYSLYRKQDILGEENGDKKERTISCFFEKEDVVN